MQNHTFWFILGSEDGQLLTGEDPEGTARRRGSPKASTSEDAESVEGWGRGRGFPPPQPTTESGERRELP